jgi:hypothetical protein
MNTHDHLLFKQYPLTGTITLSFGEAPTPYQIYDGCGAFIGGTADLAAVRRLLEPEQLCMLKTRAGHALMGVWFCNFTEASLGPHHELQFSIFVSCQEVAPITDHPLSLLVAMLTRDDVLMLCHGLWNNTPLVVAYNCEVLSLNARACESAIKRDRDQLAFSFLDKTTGAPICQGGLSEPDRASWRAGLAFAFRLGLSQAQRLSTQPWTRMCIVNPVGVTLPENAMAEAFTKNAANALRYYDARGDSLMLDAPPYADLGFQPRFVQFFQGIKFVYLNPRVGGR